MSTFPCSIWTDKCSSPTIISLHAREPTSPLGSSVLQTIAAVKKPIPGAFGFLGGTCCGLVKAPAVLSFPTKRITVDKTSCTKHEHKDCLSELAGAKPGGKWSQRCPRLTRAQRGVWKRGQMWHSSGKGTLSFYCRAVCPGNYSLPFVLTGTAVLSLPVSPQE